MNHQSRVDADVFQMLPSEQNPSPMVRINTMNPSPEFTLYARLERMNPFGSVKDRAAVDPSKGTIAYCRIGERSSHTWFMLKYLLGLNNVKNYDGSWTDYGSVIGVPIEK